VDIGGGRGGEDENKGRFNLRHQSFVVLLFLYQICLCFYQVKENKHKSMENNNIKKNARKLVVHHL